MWTGGNSPLTRADVCDHQVHLLLFKYLRPRKENPHSSTWHCEATKGKDTIRDSKCDIHINSEEELLMAIILGPRGGIRLNRAEDDRSKGTH